MSRALVVLSGGQDSTTCLFLAKQRYAEVFAVTFDYGQRHKAEIESAIKVGQMADVARHDIVIVGNILESTSPLVSTSKLEQYPGMYDLPGGVEKTFVPLRNQLFLTLAYNRAVAWSCEVIYTGVSQEDFGGYPDCRSGFIRALEIASNTGLAEAASPVRILTPLMSLTKRETVELSYKLPGCWDAMAYTHTAYDGAYPPTGMDHATLLRAKGFLEANLPDPLVLRAYTEGLMELPDTGNYEEFRRAHGMI